MDGIVRRSPLVPKNENNLSFLCVMMYFHVNSFCDVWFPSKFWICIFMKKVADATQAFKFGHIFLQSPLSPG